MLLILNHWKAFTLPISWSYSHWVQLSLHSHIPISLCSKKLLHMLSIEMSGDTQRNPQRRCGVEALGATRHEGDRSHRSPVHRTDMRGDRLHTSLYTGQTLGGHVTHIPSTQDRHEGDRSHRSLVQGTVMRGRGLTDPLYTGQRTSVSLSRHSSMSSTMCQVMSCSSLPYFLTNLCIFSTTSWATMKLFVCRTCKSVK